MKRPVAPTSPGGREDEPTRIVAISNGSRRETVRGMPEARPPVAADEPSGRGPVTGTRLLRNSNGCGSSGHYRVCDPAQGVTQVSLPPPGTRSEPPRRSSPAPEQTGKPAQEVVDEHFRLAELLGVRGNLRAAVFEAQLGMKLGRPRPPQRALYAWLLYRRDGAGTYVAPCVWEHLERALEADPNCATAHYYKAMLLKQAGHCLAATEHFERAIALDPGDERARSELRLLTRR